MMVLGEIANLLSGKAKVVGTVGTLDGIRAASRLKPGTVDFIEIRADGLTKEVDQALEALRRVAIPLIVTVRHHSEGGKIVMSAAERQSLFSAFLPKATLIDVELRWAHHLKPILRDAAAGGLGLIVSYHDFAGTPRPNQLRQCQERARRMKATVLKVAAVTKTSRDVATLLSLFPPPRGLRLSVMGMGRFGKVSRLLFAQAGSVLNYGYIDKPQAPGQWPAVLLRQRVDETGSE